MNKDFFKGFILAFTLLGIIGTLTAVGFHSANEILGGNFTGNYTFTGDVDFNSANISGIGASVGTAFYENSQEFNISGNFIVPVGVNEVLVLVLGGGGAGGPSGVMEVDYRGSGPGGGSGAMVTALVPVTPGENIPIVVANGGSSSSWTYGYNGGTSKFGNYVFAQGGYGGGSGNIATIDEGGNGGYLPTLNNGSIFLSLISFDGYADGRGAETIFGLGGTLNNPAPISNYGSGGGGATGSYGKGKAGANGLVRIYWK